DLGAEPHVPGLADLRLVDRHLEGVGRRARELLRGLGEDLAASVLEDDPEDRPWREEDALSVEDLPRHDQRLVPSFDARLGFLIEPAARAPREERQTNEGEEDGSFVHRTFDPRTTAHRKPLAARGAFHGWPGDDARHPC